MKKISLIFILCLLFVFAGCGENSGDGGKGGSGESDSDADAAEAGNPDAEGQDSETADTEQQDSEAADAEQQDSEAADTEQQDPDSPDSDMIQDDPCAEFEGAIYDEESNGCRCPEGYHWGEGEDSGKCVPGSDTLPDPCEGLEGAVFDEEKHGCRCPEGYTWSADAGNKRCVPDPLYDACINAGGIFTEYSACICPEGYQWNDADECVPIPTTSPCFSNPCSGVKNSDGGCVATGEKTYTCTCIYNFVFDSLTNKCVVPECSPESGTPCYDKETKLYWSSYFTAEWYLANATCYNLLEATIDDWELPTVDELRTLFKGCGKIEPEGICGVSDEAGCLGQSCGSDCAPLAAECPADSEGEGLYGKLFNDSGDLWSSSALSEDEDSVWYISFDTPGVFSDSKSSGAKGVRCVRKSN